MARETHSKGLARPRISSRSVGATGCGGGESADWVDGDEPVDRPVGPQPAEHRSQQERRQMDAVGDQGHKRQFLTGEHPMEDVVVAREEMGAEGTSHARLG